MKKISVTVLVLFILVIWYSGCSPSLEEDPVQTHKLRLAFITSVSEAKFFIPLKKGMKDAAEMLDVQCDFMGPAGIDVDKQIEIIRQAVDDGYDGLAVNLIDPEAFDDVVEETLKRGIPVVGFNVDDHATPNARMSSVNQRLYEAGQSLAHHLLDFIPQDSSILVTMHDEGVSALEDRRDGLLEVLKAEKNVKATVIFTGNDALKGMGIISRTLAENPDIRIIIGTGQSDTEAAGRAIELFGSGSGYWAAGFDLSPKTLECIQNGNIRCTVDQQPYIQGFYPVVQLTHFLRYGIKPSNIDSGASFIDKTNIEQVLELSQQHYR
ncbi:substrate-binding domain-containing protein [Acidobacteriota bacterium]